MSSLRIVLAGAANRGVPSLEERLPDAAIVPVAEGDAVTLRETLATADAVVCTHLTHLDTALARRLRLVQTLGAGHDGIAREALPPGCALCNVFEHETAISEWILMAMLALTRRLLVYDRDLRRGEWHEAASFSGAPELDLRGRTAGLIGLGHIGGRTAELLRAVGMRVVGVTRHPRRERAERHGLAWVGGLDALGNLLDEADFAVVCLPLLPETEGLIGAGELDRLGPGGYLLNVSRGPIVDERALYEALRDGRIAGAAIDVWYRYPQRSREVVMPASLPFWELENVVMTPHSSGWSASMLAGRWRFIAEQMARLAAGRTFENIVYRAPFRAVGSPTYRRR